MDYLSSGAVSYLKDNIPPICFEPSVRRSKVAEKAQVNAIFPGEALGLKLLKSVREMKTGEVGRVSSVEPNEVIQARHNTGLAKP